LLLSTDLWVSALMRRAEQGGAFAVLVRKGDARAGAVLVKLINRREAWTRLYGERVWMRPAGSESEADIDAYVARSLKIDPDLWVVEIDDNQGRHFLTEAVER
jgi:hypothetical protein